MTASRTKTTKKRSFSRRKRIVRRKRRMLKVFHYAVFSCYLLTLGFVLYAVRVHFLKKLNKLSAVGSNRPFSYTQERESLGEPHLTLSETEKTNTVEKARENDEAVITN